MNEDLQQQDKNKLERLRFEVIEKREGITEYVFPHVLVTINTRQQEQRGAPELVYATFDYHKEHASLDRPDYKRPGVDMQYVVNCIKEVVRVTGESRFWVYPYDEDSLGAEQRLEQWKKHFGLEPAPEHGYYINL